MVITMVKKLNLRNFSWLYLLSLIVGIVLIIGTILVPAQQVYATGNTYYVAKNGSDVNPGTESQPWLTIQKAANTLVAGDMVYVRSGIYNEYVYIGTSGPYTGKSGTQANPIVYKAYPGESPIIDGIGLPNPYSYSVITSYNLSYCTIEGFELRNSSVHGFRGLGIYSHLTLRNLKIHDCQMSGILLSDDSYTTIDNCEVFRTNSITSDEQISMIHSTDFEIKNCVFHNSNKNALDCKEGCRNGLIHDNEIYGNNDTTTGIYIDGGYADQDTDNIKIYNNKIHDCIAPAIVLGSETSPYHAVTNVDVYNNLLYNNFTGFAVWPNPFTRTFRIINNTFYHNNADIAIYGSGANAGVNLNCIIRNNIIDSLNGNEPLINYDDISGGVINVDHNLYYDPSGTYNITPSMKGTNAIQADPLFVNPGVDFRLQSGSPAINASSSTLAPTTDYAGNARPSGAGFDIGAYEYVNTVPVLDHITVTPSNPSIAVGGTQTYSAQGYDSNNNVISGLTYTWSVTNATAGSINSSGLFTAGTTAGSYSNVIQAISGGKTGNASVTITAQHYAQVDINMDGKVNVLDMILVGQHQGQSGTSGWIREDVNADGVINVLDSIIVGQHWNG